MIRGSQHLHVWHSFGVAAVLAALLTSVGTPSAQSGYVHLNPVVEALAQGRHVFGVSTSDLSLENAVALAGNPNLDYVYLDMEHNPLRFQEMKHFLAFITAGDKAGMIKRGNGQVRPAVFARFPPYGREQTLWMVKHALDIGLNGILINNVETREQAENIVRTMRPTQRRDSKIPNAAGRAWHRGVRLLGGRRGGLPSPRRSLAAQSGWRPDFLADDRDDGGRAER